MWHFETRTETFLIQMARPGEYELWLNHKLLGTYPDGNSAAQTVYVCATGDSIWDDQPHAGVPSDIKGWLPGEPDGYEPE